MKVRLLYFEGCPGVDNAKEHLNAALTELGIDVNYDVIDVVKLRNQTNGDLIGSFYGSPTINIEQNGQWIDLFNQTGVSMMANRNYTYNDVRTPYASKDMIIKKIKRMQQFA